MVPLENCQSSKKYGLGLGRLPFNHQVGIPPITKLFFFTNVFITNIQATDKADTPIHC